MQQPDSTQHFSAYGKFLITGEYAVLDNVTALAVPLKLKQHLEVTTLQNKEIHWKSYDGDGSLWFELKSNLNEIYGQHTFKDPVAAKLAQILRSAQSLNSKLKIEQGFSAVTRLDFNRKYGMGTSSTLISLIAQWTGCDVYKLQFACFGGSGYDIACANARRALVYNYNDSDPIVKPFVFDPQIKEKLFLVYLNEKQNSRDSIARFDPNLLTTDLKQTLNEMPERFIKAGNNLDIFNALIDEHESIISQLVNLQPVKQRLFSDFAGSVKSLGGWGGDFVMATGGKEQRKYFKNKGYDVIIEWDDVVMNDQ
jgi:hypothetical protein